MLHATLKFFFSAPMAGWVSRTAHSRQLKTTAVRRKCNDIESLKAFALQCKAYAALFGCHCRDCANRFGKTACGRFSDITPWIAGKKRGFCRLRLRKECA